MSNILYKKFMTLGYVILSKNPTLLSDKSYLKFMYKFFFGKSLNLDNPKAYTEKCQWLKLYDRRPIYTQMVDKYEAKKFVADRIGDKYVIPCFGVWNTPEEIDYDSLPNQFVLKCNHDSGSVIVIKDKSKIDKEEVCKKLHASLSVDYSVGAREWPYKNVKRRILAEQYIDSLGKPESVEYKVTCMDGEVKFITICQGIAHSSYNVRTNDHYTPNWEKLDFYVNYKPSGKQWERPAFTDELISLCEKLSKDTPYLRVDWYVVDGKLYFGEMTFYTWGGMCQFTPEEWDYKLGDMLKLPVH